MNDVKTNNSGELQADKKSTVEEQIIINKIFQIYHKLVQIE